MLDEAQKDRQLKEVTEQMRNLKIEQQETSRKLFEQTELASDLNRKLEGQAHELAASQQDRERLKREVDLHAAATPASIELATLKAKFEKMEDETKEHKEARGRSEGEKRQLEEKYANTQQQIREAEQRIEQASQREKGALVRSKTVISLIPAFQPWRRSARPGKRAATLMKSPRQRV